MEDLHGAHRTLGQDDAENNGTKREKTKPVKPFIGEPVDIPCMMADTLGTRQN
ncbi:MAG: hypothetical protein R8G34_16515 [Paracoccaceae bacterium]|nr:hypothetical protein [Paracoccaceae bacterium]